MVGVHFNDTDLQGIVEISRNTPTEDVISELKKGLQLCNRNKARLLKSSLILGSCLNKAYKAYEYHREAGTIKET